MTSNARLVQVEFATEDEFLREYTGNIANGGIFVAGAADFDIHDSIQVEIFLSYCGESLLLEGEVVHVVPEEMAGTGAKPGAAVQFSAPARELRQTFESRLGVSAPTERDTGAGRRRSLRSKARLPTTITTSKATMSTRTRDLSTTGALISVGDEPVPIGQSIDIALTNPSTGETMEVEAKVVRHLKTDLGEVSAMGVEFTTDEEGAVEVARFITEAKAAEHSRRLGGISGPIAELGIENLLQMFGTCAQEGMLTVTHNAEEGLIVFERGFLYKAVLGPYKGPDALTKMLTWREGTFEFQARIDAEIERDEPIPLSGALLDALCDLDEGQRAAQAEDDDSIEFDEGGALEFADDVDLDDIALEDLGFVEDEAEALQTEIPPNAEIRANTAKVKAHAEDFSRTEEAILDLAAVGTTAQKLCGVIPETEDAVYSALQDLLSQGLVEIQE